MNDSLLSKLHRTILFFFFIMLALTCADQACSFAAVEVHRFELTSGFKDSTDMRPREIIFKVEYPGRIEIDTSWTPCNKKLTITLYDQEGKALIGKKDKSPLHLAYDYDKDHFEKAKHFGSSFRVEISQSLFRSISGSVQIKTPGKKIVEEENHDIIRGPYGTFIDEEESH